MLNLEESSDESSEDRKVRRRKNVRKVSDGENPIMSQVSEKKRNAKLKGKEEKSKESKLEEAGKVQYIDTLPNDEKELRALLREVKGHIKTLEKQFFEQENSEGEEEELKEMMVSNNHYKDVEHDEKLLQLQ